MTLRPIFATFVFAALVLPARGQFGPAPVITAPVEQREVEAGQMFVGTVMPRRHSVVGSAVSGRVAEFLVDEGDPVKSGQPLARLLTETIDIQIAAARAEFELRTAELLEMENGARPEEKQQAESRLLSAKALMDYAKFRLQRTRTLIAKNAASQDQLEDNISAAEAATQAYNVALAERDLVLAGPRKEKIAQAKARQESARQELTRLEDQKVKHTMIAPFNGYVTREFTEVGQWIMSGDHVAEVVEIDRVDVDVQVPERYVPKLREQTAVRVEIESLPDHIFTGPIVRIVPQADLRSRNFPVKVRLENPNGLLKPGMLARAVLPVDAKHPALLAPKDAIVLGGPQPLVYVATAGGAKGKSVARPVPVRLGVEVGNSIELIGEIQAGDQVVIEGNERLMPGQELIPTVRATAEKSGAGSAR